MKKEFKSTKSFDSSYVGKQKYHPVHSQDPDGDLVMVELVVEYGTIRTASTRGFFCTLYCVGLICVGGSRIEYHSQGPKLVYAFKKSTGS